MVHSNLPPLTVPQVEAAIMEQLRGGSSTAAGTLKKRIRSRYGQEALTSATFNKALGSLIKKNKVVKYKDVYKSAPS